MTPPQRHRKRNQVYVIWGAALIMAVIFLMAIPPA